MDYRTALGATAGRSRRARRAAPDERDGARADAPRLYTFSERTVAVPKVSVIDSCGSFHIPVVATIRSPGTIQVDDLPDGLAVDRSSCHSRRRTSASTLAASRPRFLSIR